MTAPGDIVLLIVLAAVLTACAGYAAGRLHQRRQSGPDMREAYKSGYEAATRNVFSMAARAAGRRPVAPEVVTDVADVPKAPELVTDAADVPEVAAVPEVAGVPAQREGRHTVPDELVRAATYRLPADRVARAKVPRPRD
ncbi:hypothetical protein AB0G04_29390 [Actinoplanes sp. NPDC023801]|uniref:hypothetical protein n=1 Tax=Actinoplanes sp. NPDC023801 TaxID=3154595 RepID=UPI0033D843F3